MLENGKLSGHLAAADVFVFPSRTDTFGVVQLEALASGVPVAAFPVTGPKDVIANNPSAR
jgi:glycosyltransferase involved in cell wall biosynthesis